MGDRIRLIAVLLIVSATLAGCGATRVLTTTVVLRQTVTQDQTVTQVRTVTEAKKASATPIPSASGNTGDLTDTVATAITARVQALVGTAEQLQNASENTNCDADEAGNVFTCELSDQAGNEIEYDVTVTGSSYTAHLNDSGSFPAGGQLGTAPPSVYPQTVSGQL